MIYEVKKDDVVLEVDDMVFFAEQSEEFRRIFENGRNARDDANVIAITLSNNVEFDNCFVAVYDNGRVIIN